MLLDLQNLSSNDDLTSHILPHPLYMLSHDNVTGQFYIMCQNELTLDPGNLLSLIIM